MVENIGFISDNQECRYRCSRCECLECKLRQRWICLKNYVQNLERFRCVQNLLNASPTLLTEFKYKTIASCYMEFTLSDEFRFLRDIVFLKNYRNKLNIKTVLQLFFCYNFGHFLLQEIISKYYLSFNIKHK